MQIMGRYNQPGGPPRVVWNFVSARRDRCVSTLTRAAWIWGNYVKNLIHLLWSGRTDNRSREEGGETWTVPMGQTPHVNTNKSNHSTAGKSAQSCSDLYQTITMACTLGSEASSHIVYRTNTGRYQHREPTVSPGRLVSQRRYGVTHAIDLPRPTLALDVDAAAQDRKIQEIKAKCISGHRILEQLKVSPEFCHSSEILTDHPGD